MATVRVKFFGPIDIKGVGTELNFEADDVQELWDGLMSRYELRERHLSEFKYAITVNGVLIDDQFRKLRDGDEVKVIPLFDGG